MDEELSRCAEAEAAQAASGPTSVDVDMTAPQPGSRDGFPVIAGPSSKQQPAIHRIALAVKISKQPSPPSNLDSTNMIRLAHQ